MSEQTPVAELEKPFYLADSVDDNQLAPGENESLSPQEPKTPNGEALQQFTDEILRSPLSPEIAQRITDLREAKNQDSHAQLERLKATREEFESGLLGRWLYKGELAPPSVVEEHRDSLIQGLTDATKHYEQSAEGRKDVLIRDLRQFLGGSEPSSQQLVQLAGELGVSVSKFKHAIPRLRTRLVAQLRPLAEQRLNELAPPGTDFDDRPQTWQDRARLEARSEADTELFKIGETGLATLTGAMHSFDEKYRLAYDPRRAPPGGIETLRSDIEKLEVAQGHSAKELVQQIGESRELQSLIVRGSLTAEEAIDRLRSTERSKNRGGSFRGMLKRPIITEWLEAKNRLPEPSLVGLSLTAKEIDGVHECMDEIERLAEVFGVTPYEKSETAKRQLLQEIKSSQDLFFERIDTPNSLYWHFTTKGLKIIETEGLQSGEMVKDRNTSEFSKGVHFIKPGTGIETSIQYHAYALGIRSNAGHAIEDAFGMAIIYRLGDIAKVTPLRDEPVTEVWRDKGNVSEDVTFRASTGSSEYEYPLEDAYLLPFASWEQLGQLRVDQRYSDLFREPGTPAYKIAKEVAARALREAGHTDEWIGRHLLDSEKLVNGLFAMGSRSHEKLETELFRRVTQEIRRNLAEDQRIIVPLSALKGGYEGHDAKFGWVEDWKEELIELKAA